MSELQSFLDKLPPEQFVVALYVNTASHSQDEWMNPLATECRKLGYATIGLLSPNATKVFSLDTTDLTVIIEPKEIEQYSRINVFANMDTDSLSTKYPQNSRALSVMHACKSYEENYVMTFHLNFLPYSDGCLITFPLPEKKKQQITDLWYGFHQPKASLRTHKNFYIIPNGYPKYGVLVQNIAKMNVQPDAITYAPVVHGYAPEMGGNRIAKYGKRILRTILNCFPDKKAIFRPRSGNLGHKDIQEIVDYFANEPRFILDTNRDKEFCFAHSEILITDMSGIAQSFVATTLRPAIYFQPWDDGLGIYRHSNGFVAYQFNDLVNCLRMCFNEKEKITDYLRNNRDTKLVPFEKASEDFAKFLPDFYHDRPYPSWLAIPRFPEKQQSEAQIVEKLLNIVCETYYFTSAAVAANPESKLILATCLHINKVKIPDRGLYTLGGLIRRTAKEYYNLDLNMSKWADVPNEIILELYEKALVEQKQKGDAYSITLATGLKNSFKRDVMNIKLRQN